MCEHSRYIGKSGENDVFRAESLFQQKTHAMSQYFRLPRSRASEDLEDRVWRCCDSFSLSLVELHVALFESVRIESALRGIDRDRV